MRVDGGEGEDAVGQAGHGEAAAHPGEVAAKPVQEETEQWRGDGRDEVDEANDEVCVLSAVVVLGLEQSLGQRDEGEDGAVVGEGGEAEQPEGCRELSDVRQADVLLRSGLHRPQLRPLPPPVHQGQEEAGQEGDEGEAGGRDEGPAQGRHRVQVLPEEGVERLHQQEVDGAANSADAQLEAEDHVELPVPEPGHGVGVESHVEALPAHPETEAGHLHEPEGVVESSHSQQDLTQQDEGREDESPEPEAKHGVNEESSNDGEHEVWPGVAGVEGGELGGGQVEGGLHL